MQQEQPVYVAPPAKSSNVMMIVSIIAIVFLVLAVIGLGVWGYMQTSALNATKAELAALQADHTALTAERDGLSSDLDKTKSELASTQSELEATKTELETTKADLAKSKDETAALQAKIDKANKIINVLTGFWADSFDTMEEKIKDTDNSDMLKAFNTFLKGTDFFNDLAAFQNVIFDTLADTLK